MQGKIYGRVSKGLLSFLVIAGAASLLHGQVSAQPQQSRIELPADCVTPDGMAVAPDASLVVACPNYASYKKGATKPSVPAVFLKVGADMKPRKWFDSPVLEETGRSCPMGIDFGPSGELYVVDNQNWPTGNGNNGEINQGRILRLKIQNDKVVETTVVAKGISHPNGIKYRDEMLYVTVSTLPTVKRADGLLTSAVYRFPANGRDIQVTNTLADKHLLASFVTENRSVQYGADGIAFDSMGRLYIGNFGDGKVHKIVFDATEKVSEVKVFAKTDLDYSLLPKSKGFLAKAASAKMRTTDGIFIDRKDNLYVADFSNNAIARVTPEGAISVVTQNGDTGGRNGDLNEPGEPIIWNGKLIVSNFDVVVGPDKVNRKHESPATLSVIDLQ